MKKILVLTLVSCFSFFSCDTAKQILDTYGTSLPGSELSNAEIVSGLRDALTVGTGRTTSQLSSVDGFFKDAVIKIAKNAGHDVSNRNYIEAIIESIEQV